MRKPGRPPVLPDVVEEHFDELDFLHELREANLFTPDWDLAYLAWHESRCEAHLDGLRLAERHGTDLATARLAGGTAGAALAATLVLGADPTGEHLPAIAAAFAGGEPPVVDGIRRALRHDLPAALRAPLRALLDHTEPHRAAAAADVLAFHREGDLPLPRLLAEPVPAVALLALGIAARSREVAAEALHAHREHAEPAVREAALRAAAALGDPTLLPHCRAAAGRETDPDPVALLLLGALGDPSDEARIAAALQRPELASTALAAFGASGRPEVVPRLLDAMGDAKLGGAAARAYRRITGGDPFGDKPFPPAPVADGADEPEELPPDPAKARADWQRRSRTMPAGRWFQGGLEVSGDPLPASFDRLTLAARRDVLLRLRARRAGVPDLELEARALMQRRA